MWGQKKKPERKTEKKLEKPAKHVFSAGDKVCFSLPDAKTRESVWHIGEIIAIPLGQDPSEKPRMAQVVLFVLIDNTLKAREIEHWETDAPPYFDMPREILILDRLLSQTIWEDKKLPTPVEVDLEKMCLAKHVPFINLLAPKPSWEQIPYRRRWSS